MWTCLRAEADARAAADRKSALNSVHKRAQRAYDVGAGDLLAVQEARAELDAADSRLLAARSAVHIAERDLVRLTHAETDALADLGSIVPEGPQPDRVEKWVETALESQPLLTKAREELVARRQQAVAAGRARWPSVSLDAQYSYGDGTFAPDIERKEGLVGVQVAWPLFQGGEISAARRRAEALAEAARYEVQDAEDTIRVTVEKVFLTLVDSVAQLEATTRALESATSSLAATQKGCELGSRSVVDLLDSVRRHTDAQTANNAALYQHVLSRVFLKAAAGVLSKRDVEALNGMLKPVDAENSASSKTDISMAQQ